MSLGDASADDELRLAPEDSTTPARPVSDLDERTEQLTRQAEAPVTIERPEPPQFSLRAMFFYTTLGAIGLASITWLPPAPTAGVLGLVTLVVFLATRVTAPDSDRANRFCVALLILYVSAVAGILLRQWTS